MCLPDLHFFLDQSVIVIIIYLDVPHTCNTGDMILTAVQQLAFVKNRQETIYLAMPRNYVEHPLCSQV